MKINSGLLFCFLGLAGITTAQTPTKTDSKENIKFFNTLYAKKDTTIDDCLFQVVKISGDIKTQKIKIEIRLTNKIKNRKIFIDDSNTQFVSSEGDYIPLLTGFNVTETELYTDVPIKTSCTIGTLLSTQKHIKLIALKYGLADGSTKWGVAEFRDIAIEWN